MAQVPKFTNRQSVPGTTGMQNVPLSLASSPLTGIGEGLTEVSKGLEAAGQRIQRRNDLISSSVSRKQFGQEIITNYNSILDVDSEKILNPSIIGSFNAENEQRIIERVNNFNGSDDARAELEANLRNVAGEYENNLIIKQNSLQRAFMTKVVQDEIGPIAAAVADDPGSFRESFDEVDLVINKYEDALGYEGAENMRSQGRSLVMEQAVGGLLANGEWKAADELLLDNPVLMKHLAPSAKKAFENRINAFQQAEQKTIVEMAGLEATLARLNELGIPIDPDKAAEFIAGTDLSPDETIGEKLLKRRAEFEISEEVYDNMSLSQKAALVGINIAPDPVYDFNKDRLPDGKLSPQGAEKATVKYLESSIHYHEKIGMIEAQYAEFQSGNKLAALGVLQGYLKLIDDGAVVRDSDIKLAGTSTSFLDRIQTGVDSLIGGQAVSDTIVEEAIKASRVFRDVGMQVSKQQIDGILESTGYNPQQINISQATYDTLFGGVRTVPPGVVNDDKPTTFSDTTPTTPAATTPAAATAGDAPVFGDGVGDGDVVVTRNPDGTIKIGGN